jgi:DNA-binding transcriptional ArsR family regulator
MTHIGDVDMAVIGSAMADRRRAAVLLALLDGRALPASVLAGEAGVAASTASSHLGKLVDAGLVTVEPNGRHRYYRLAGPEVAKMLEAVARLAPPMKVRSLRQGTRAEAMRTARLCYDHLAGSGWRSCRRSWRKAQSPAVTASTWPTAPIVWPRRAAR